MSGFRIHFYRHNEIFFFLGSDVYLENCSMFARNSSIWMIFNSKGINKLNMKILQRIKLNLLSHVLLEYMSVKFKI